MYKLIAALVATALTFVLSSVSDAASIGNWVTGSSDNGNLFAASTNDSGETLMKACNPSQGICYWYLVTTASCQVAMVVPALFSTSSGAYSMNLICDAPLSVAGRAMYRAKISKPDVMDSLLDSNRPLGIAVALDDGQFRVYRFSMVGAKPAISILMRAAAKMRQNGSKAQGTQDQSL